ncbi:hypothetical protein FPHYL_5938 [Fusarium phyllophilum]|uniref:Uncharacterized protein n=1 Tax=Fusarium phyllophilum TaxID=47803 RepID=A0A8H5JUM5_9HYPO|nr:hypothetical protein FPHYL_5938 [Fusarium phyllophilum]
MVSKWFALTPGLQNRVVRQPKAGAGILPLVLWVVRPPTHSLTPPKRNVGNAYDSQAFIKMSVDDVNETAAFIISSPKTRQIQALHHNSIITDYPIIMPNPHYITVPRGEDPSPDIQQESASFSEQMKNWLQQGHKDMPWHNIDSVAVSDTQHNSNVNVAPSDTPATQGSDN